MSSTSTQHYVLFLEQFDYTIKCNRSKENANADALSRLSNAEMYTFTAEVYTIEEEIIENLPVTACDVKAETKSDVEIKTLLECLKYGRKCGSKNCFGI